LAKSALAQLGTGLFPPPLLLPPPPPVCGPRTWAVGLCHGGFPWSRWTLAHPKGRQQPQQQHQWHNSNNEGRKELSPSINHRTSNHQFKLAKKKEKRKSAALLCLLSICCFIQSFIIFILFLQ
jgi:hypothetical protein